MKKLFIIIFLFLGIICCTNPDKIADHRIRQIYDSCRVYKDGLNYIVIVNDSIIHRVEFKFENNCKKEIVNRYFINYYEKEN